mgnify:CR=1 FL=1
MIIRNILAFQLIELIITINLISQESDHLLFLEKLKSKT